MDKRITPQGILRSEKRVDKKHAYDLRSNRCKESNKESKEKFEINKNEFPSLNEISDKCSNGKNLLEFKPTSYSEKLKNASDKSKSLKFESVHDSHRSEIFFNKESSIGSSKKNDSLNIPSPSVGSRLAAAGSSNQNSGEATKPLMNQNSERKAPMYVPPFKRFVSGKQDTDSKDDSCLERSRRAKSTSDQIVKLPDHAKTQHQRPAFKVDNSKAYERKPAANCNLQTAKSSASTSGTTNVKRQEKNLNPQDKKGAVPEQDSLTGEAKKKKKRKSKVKRQAALQSGKILVLTPELHSKILNQSNITHSKQNPCAVTNINDSEEYPELGSSVKTNKENVVKSVESSCKESLHPEKEVEAKLNDLNLTLPSLVDSEGHKDQEMVAKPPDKEKVLLKDPITVSIFDMLQNVVTKKKDTAKKDETTRLEAAIGNANSFTRVIGKKGKSTASAVNPLDASRPTVKRGKEREKPKVKKPSKMRKLILIGRQLRKEEMENCEDAENTDAAYTSLSDECHSPSKFSCPVESSLVQNTESSSKSLSPSAEDEFGIEANDVSTEDFVPGVNTSSCKQISEETEMSACVSTDENLKVEVNANSLGNASELNSDTAIKEFNHISFSDKSSNELNLNPIEKFTNETASGDKLSNNGETVENSSHILKGLEVKSSNESMFSAEVRPMVVKIENKSVDVSSINTKLSDVMQQDIATTDTQENYLETEGVVPEINTNSLQMIENSSNQLMTLLKNITLKPKVTDELKIEAVKTLIHSRKFRKYCDHFTCKGIDEVVFALLDDLARFQDRMHQKDPVKAKIRKRLLYGIKEIKKHMKLKKLKGIILATDIEDIKTEGGLNDVVNEIITLAEATHIPYIFSHRRFNLGKVCRKGVPVSCVGILNYEGSEKNFKRIIELQEECKLDYLSVTNALSEVLSCDEVTEILRLGKGVLPEKLQEIRTTLLKEHFSIESKEHELQSAKSLKDSNDTKLLKDSYLFETDQIDKHKISDILLKYHFL